MASVTITLPRPIAGDEIINTVDKAISYNAPVEGPFFTMESREYRGEEILAIGQSSRHPYQHLLVTPARREREIFPQFFRSERLYVELEIMSHSWREPSLIPVHYGENEVTLEVHRLAEKLRKHFNV